MSLTSALIVQNELTTDAESVFESSYQGALQQLRVRSREVAEQRELVTLKEAEYAQLRSALLSRERHVISQGMGAFDIYKKLDADLRFLSANGTNADRAAVDAMFHRVQGSYKMSPYQLPHASLTRRVTEVLDEFYVIEVAPVDLTIPAHALQKLSGLFESFCGVGDADSYFLKLVRVHMHPKRPDVLQFIMTSAALEQHSQVASLFAVVLRINTLGTDAPGFKHTIHVNAWFGFSTGAPVFPSTRGEILNLTLRGLDRLDFKSVHSTGETGNNNPHVYSALQNIKKELGIGQLSNALPKSVIVMPDWESVAWRRKLPLEYVNSVRHKTGECYISCTPLAVRVKLGHATLASSFSCLCFHEKSGQLFWHVFDPRGLASLYIDEDESNRDDDIGCPIDSCRCKASSPVSVAPRLNASQAVPTSPLDELTRSMAFDDATLAFYADLERVAQSSAVDLSKVLEEAREYATHTPTIDGMIPKVGYSVVIPSPTEFGNSTSSSSASTTTTGSRGVESQRTHVKKPRERTDDPQSGDSPSDLTEHAPAKKKKGKAPVALPVGFLVAKTVGGKAKSVTRCGKCGILGVKERTHQKSNHGCRGVLTQDELKSWFASLAAEQIDPTTLIEET